MILYCDWGGTYFRYGRTGEEPIVMESDSFDLFAFVEKEQSRSPITQLNISYAGQIEEGVILSAPNISTHRFDIRHEFASRYGIEVRIENDLKCAALAEAAVRNASNIALIYAGTGLGGAFYEERLIRGYHNLAGEIGHIPYKEAPFACGCGKNDCLELYASGSGLHKWLEYEGFAVDTKLFDLYHSDDFRKKTIAYNLVSGLVRAASTVLTLFNPQILVIGGGIIEKEPWLFEEVRGEVLAKTFSPALRDVRIEKPIYPNSSIEGAKLL